MVRNFILCVSCRIKLRRRSLSVPGLLGSTLIFGLISIFLLRNFILQNKVTLNEVLSGMNEVLRELNEVLSGMDGVLSEMNEVSQAQQLAPAKLNNLIPNSGSK